MKFESLKAIKNLEEQLQSGYSLPIFRGYVAIKRQGVEKLIDDLYYSLPTDLLKAKQFLKERENASSRLNTSKQDETIYDNTKLLELYIYSVLEFAGYTIVNIKKFENLINKMYKSIPEEITEVENFEN